MSEQERGREKVKYSSDGSDDDDDFACGNCGSSFVGPIIAACSRSPHIVALMTSKSCVTDYTLSVHTPA